MLKVKHGIYIFHRMISNVFTKRWINLKALYVFSIVLAILNNSAFARKSTNNDEYIQKTEESLQQCMANSGSLPVNMLECFAQAQERYESLLRSNIKRTNFRCKKHTTPQMCLNMLESTQRHFLDYVQKMQEAMVQYRGASNETIESLLRAEMLLELTKERALSLEYDLN